jgi:hypothetical protein
MALHPPLPTTNTNDTTLLRLETATRSGPHLSSFSLTTACANSVDQYGKDAFDKYVKQYGRDSGRRDLLTKVLSVKPGAGEAVLTDRQAYMEVANLVFAGTGTFTHPSPPLTIIDIGCRHHKHDADIYVLGARPASFVARSTPKGAPRPSPSSRSDSVTFSGVGRPACTRGCDQ